MDIDMDMDMLFFNSWESSQARRALCVLVFFAKKGGGRGAVDIYHYACTEMYGPFVCSYSVRKGVYV